MIDTIICGDCLEELPRLADASIDLVVTDPPYGISFMGKSWDKALPSVEVWRECLRVLKPGAFAFVMCIPRQDCLSRMIINLEDAGFMVNFSPIYWTYATGFPKSANLSKLATKRIPGKVREIKKWLAIQVGKCEKTKAEINGQCGFSACSYLVTEPRQDNAGRDTWHLVLPYGTKWEKMKEVIGFDGKYDTDIEALAVVSSTRKAPKEKRYTYGEFSGVVSEYELTPEAKALDGAYAGLQMKPCVEVVICVMKPLSEKTYLDQALTNGHGLTWLDDGRIPHGEPMKTTVRKQNARKGQALHLNEANTGWAEGTIASPAPQGRFAPNLLCSDDVLNDGRVRKSTPFRRKTGPTTFGGVFGNEKPVQSDAMYGDSGSFSRYFSLDAWSEKNLPESVNRTFPFLIVPKASKSEKNAGLDGLEEKERRTMGKGLTGISGDRTGSGKKETIKTGVNKMKNSHATVKPIKLMSYLIAIGSRPGDVVLDPYAGTCTTGIAAALLDRRYICIEQDADGDGWCDIGERRIAWHVEQAKEEQAQLKLDLGRI